MSAIAPKGWETILDTFNSILEEVKQNPKGNLRFDLRFVKVSDIKEQYYCEQQVELKKIHGETENEQTKSGSDAHEKLLADAIKIKRQDTLRKIFTEETPLVFREMMLAGKHNGITILGVADCVIFYKGFPLLLLDYKFKRKVTIYDDELLQAGLYSYLLNTMGFDTSHIRYGVVAADSELRGNKELSKIHHDIVSKYRGQSHIDTIIDNKEVSIVLKELDIHKVIRELEWTLPFWMKQRDPVPTKNERKCMKCDFKDTCQFSLVRIKG